MRQMRHVKPHSKAVCILAPPCAHMVTARFGQSDRPRLNKSRIRRRRKKALAPCENTGKFPQKHSAKCVKNARRRTTEKLQVASPAPFLLHATFQGERYARYARRTQKNTQNPLCASPAPLLLHATFQGERYARYARRIQEKYSKSVMRLFCAASFTRYFSRRTVRALCSADTKKKYSKSVMRLSIQSENKRKITLTLMTIKSAIRTSNIARTTMI